MVKTKNYINQDRRNAAEYNNNTIDTKCCNGLHKKLLSATALTFDKIRHECVFWFSFFMLVNGEDQKGPT